MSSVIDYLNSNTTFSQDIEKMNKEYNIEYIDAIVEWCEKHNLEVEYAAQQIKRDPVLKAKLQVEAENLNYIKKPNRLPI
jgi:isopropylmalate/homocitrate/citramalate synthase